MLVYQDSAVPVSDARAGVGHSMGYVTGGEFSDTNKQFYFWASTLGMFPLLGNGSGGRREEDEDGGR